MSIAEVLAELRGLRSEVAELSSRVHLLESGSGTVPAAAPVTVNYTNYTTPPSSPAPYVPEHLAGSPGSVIGRPTSLPSSTTSEPSEAERRAAAESIGRFLRRSLDGGARGESGRSRINLPSKVYLLCRDFRGVSYNPPQLYYSFSSICPLVKRGNTFGDSIFVGLPSLWEARLTVEAANLHWSTDGQS